MPRHQTATELRLNDILTCLRSAVTLLNDVHDGFGTPFVYAISSTILSLITIVQNVKKNKTECILLIENVHRVLYAIVNLHIKSETMGTLPPATLYNIAKFEA
ncbi:hypothetical protein B0H14DRAFT_3478718 [Mycena olivaceomarginata]|nr:hypothetical protein B0H14DRAFT_3478718 [Mycena olivaceomarginata]